MNNFSEKFYDSESKELRSNCWTFCIYPGDSLPDNYLNRIQNMHIPTLLSPVHDKDLNGNGMEKKKHIHVMMYFGKGANKSFNQVKKFVELLGGCQPEVVNNAPGLIRYFIHKDNPEKFQYSINDLMAFSGFEYLEAFENNYQDSLIYDFIEDFIEDNSINNIVVLIRLLKKQNLRNELNFVRSHTIYFGKYLDGQYQLNKKAYIDKQLSDEYKKDLDNFEDFNKKVLDK